MRTKYFILGLGLMAIGTTAVVMLVSGDDRPASPGADVRVVLVADGGHPTTSEPGQPLHALRLDGTVPATETTATVLTDENCTPDPAGISHCTNRMRLADGSELTVMHPHRMDMVPCLSPGEVVAVRAA